MILSSATRKQGQRGCRPFPLHPNPRRTCLRFAPDNFRLTIPNTYSKITMSASLRSDCCSPSLRNAVRLPSGIGVHLHRNTHRVSNGGNDPLKQKAGNLGWQREEKVP
jgi:hypothetical protein